MKNIITKVLRYVFALAGIHAVTACYGTPYTEFEVKCDVVDKETHQQVKGIQLTFGTLYSIIDEEGNKVERFSQEKEPLPYNGGVIKKRWTHFSPTNDELHIKLEDIDATDNVQYKDSIYTVSMTKKKEMKLFSSSWYRGTYVADVTLEAEQVKQ